MQVQLATEMWPRAMPECHVDIVVGHQAISDADEKRLFDIWRTVEITCMNQGGCRCKKTWAIMWVFFGLRGHSVIRLISILY